MPPWVINKTRIWTAAWDPKSGKAAPAALGLDNFSNDHVANHCNQFSNTCQLIKVQLQAGG
jgi:hypothetical protein